jgi:hypothetical protein
VRVHAVALRHGVAHGHAKHLTGECVASPHCDAIALQRSTHRLAVRAHVGDATRERLRGAALSRGASGESEATHHVRSAARIAASRTQQQHAPALKPHETGAGAVTSGRRGRPRVSSRPLLRTLRLFLAL